jgi:hypothetical protein
MPAPTRPSTLPVWVFSGPLVIQPPAPLASTGWAPGVAPGAQHHNWLFGFIYLWLLWLDYISQPSNTQATYTTTTTIADLLAPTTFILGNPTGGSFSLTLPLAANNVGKEIVVKNIGLGSPNTVTVLAQGSNVVENQASQVLSQGDYTRFVSAGGNNWWQIGGG